MALRSRPLMDRHATGEPIDQDLILIVTQANGDPAAAGAAIGVEANRSRSLIQRLILRGVKPDLAAARERPRRGAAGKAIEIVHDVHDYTHRVVRRDRLAPRKAQRSSDFARTAHEFDMSAPRRIGRDKEREQQCGNAERYDKLEE